LKTKKKLFSKQMSCNEFENEDDWCWVTSVEIDNDIKESSNLLCCHQILRQITVDIGRMSVFVDGEKHQDPERLMSTLGNNEVSRFCTQATFVRPLENLFRHFPAHHILHCPITAHPTIKIDSFSWGFFWGWLFPSQTIITASTKFTALSRRTLEKDFDIHMSYSFQLGETLGTMTFLKSVV
jgi:hypothetical protein